MSSQTRYIRSGQAPRPLRQRIGGGLFALGALGLVMAACSSDDSTQAYCDDADSLETDVQALGDIDVASDGTDAIKEALLRCSMT
jgi:hypothetical protein